MIISLNQNYIYRWKHWYHYPNWLAFDTVFGGDEANQIDALSTGGDPTVPDIPILPMSLEIIETENANFIMSGLEDEDDCLDTVDFHVA